MSKLELPDGTMECPDCEGRKTRSCSSCDGDGTVQEECDLGYEHEHDCGNCDGSGEEDCYDCGGEGYVEDPDYSTDEGL